MDNRLFSGRDEEIDNFVQINWKLLAVSAQVEFVTNIALFSWDIGKTYVVNTELLTSLNWTKEWKDTE